MRDPDFQIRGFHLFLQHYTSPQEEQMKLRHSKKALFWIFAAVMIIGACGSESWDSPGRGDSLFSLLPSGETGIDFINLVEDGAEFNILTYRNFYNGGGVAIGDINRDGLEDIYFTSNLYSNKLYLNRGGWSFEDITDSAGVGGRGSWSTGASIADVNGDGWMDIYVCFSGHIEGDRKDNELYINNGDLTFTEAAATWGLNSSANSMQAAFFDYDLDGDLDCYLLNNNLVVPNPVDFYHRSRSDIDPEGGDELYRNDGDHFTEVTLEAGIYSSNVGFGLGVSVSDLNGDMLPDIYVSNDFWERDYLYINQIDGTFSEELDDRMGSTSLNSMGTDIADLNNDGAFDIITTDMLPGDNFRNKTMTVFDPYFPADSRYRAGYHYQLLQNSLQVNDGRGKFQEIGHLSGVAASDWSWGALIFDFDNDGWKDLFISNGIFHDMTSLDFIDFISDRSNIDRVVLERGYFDWRDFSEMLASNPLANYAFVNGLSNPVMQGIGKLPTFDNRAESLGLGDPGFSNGAAYGDLDNDGDLDLVTNNLNMEAFVYRNNSGNNYLRIILQGEGKNFAGVGARVRIRHEGMEQQLQHYPVRSYESNVGQALIFGLGESDKVDELEVIWANHDRQVLKDITANQEIVVRQSEADDTFIYEAPQLNPAFQQVDLLRGDHNHTENAFNDFEYEVLLPRMFSTEGPVILTGDVNGDGLEDFILGGARNDPDKLFLQDAAGWHEAGGNWSELAGGDKALETTCGTVFDADGDGDNDLLLGSGGNEILQGREGFKLRFYENDGTGKFSVNSDKCPEAFGNFSCIISEDFDMDGDLDLFIGARVVPGNYGLIPRNYLLKNDGSGHWTDVTRMDLGTAGMISDAVWSDVDNDRDPDLILTGDWMQVKIFENMGGSINYNPFLSDPLPPGWWTAIEAADLDGDGDEDYIVGNWGLNSKLKATAERPLTMYVKDFDNNGKTEFIINWFAPIDKQAYPFHTKEDIIRQIPGLKNAQPTYEAYASKTYETLFDETSRNGALSYRTELLETSVIWNEGDTLIVEPLPLEAQLSPVFAIIAEDMDLDGHPDIWLGGNFYGLKPEVGYNNASRGVYFQGKSGKFHYVPPSESGIDVQGEVRDAVTFRTQEGLRLLIARNNLSTVMFEKKFR